MRAGAAATAAPFPESRLIPRRYFRGGRGTQIDVDLQYAPPAGRAGAVIASWFGREPSQTIREDLRRLRQLLEAGEVPRATNTA